MLFYDYDTKKRNHDFTDNQLHIRKIPVNEQNTRCKRDVEIFLKLESDFDYQPYFV